MTHARACLRTSSAEAAGAGKERAGGDPRLRRGAGRGERGCACAVQSRPALGREGMAAAAATAGGPGGGRKPGSPRDSEAELWSRRVRELVSAGPANRLCFECGQRGVTYVDITLGSFVCTGCSGAL